MFSDQQLLQPDFDETAYLRHTLQLPSFEAEQQRLARCIDAIDSELHAAIADNANDLVDNVAHLNAAGAVVDTVQTSVGNAQSSLTRLRHVIRDPYAQVEAGVAELRNSTAALNTLRAVYRFLSLVGKFKECANDVARSARLLREVEDILAEHDLSGIEPVDAAMPVVSKTSAAVRSKALEILRSAMSRRNLGDLGLAVQCFASLGTLGKVVAEAAAERKRDALTVIVKQVSVAVLQGDTDQALSKLDGALHIIADHSTSLAELWKALRRRDAGSQRPFIDSVAAHTDPQALLQDYWKSVSEHLAEQLQRVTRKGALHAMMVAEYSRFHKILVGFATAQRDLFAAILGDSRDSPAVAVLARSKTDEWLKLSIGDIEEKFRQNFKDRLREKLTALTARVGAALPVGGADDPIDISADPKTGAAVPSAAATFDGAARGLVKVIHHDLATNRQDAHTLDIALDVAGTVLNNAAAALRDGAAKLPVRELPSVAVTVTAGQLYHVSIANAAALLAVEMQSAVAMLPRIGGAAGAGAGSPMGSPAGSPTAAAGPSDGSSSGLGAVRTAIATLEKLSESIVRPFFDSAVVAISRHIDDLFPADGILTASTATSSNKAAPGMTGINPHLSARGTQLHTRLWHFLTRFALLFDRQTPGLEKAQRSLADAVARQFLANTLTSAVQDSGARRTVVADLENVASVLNSLYAVDRLERTGKAFRHVIRLLKSTERESIPNAAETRQLAARGHPAVVLLALVARVDARHLAVDLTTGTRLSRDELRGIVCEGLKVGGTKGCGKLWEGVVRSCLGETAVGDTEEVEAVPSKAPHAPTQPPPAGNAEAEGGATEPTATEPPAVEKKRVPTVAALVKRACLALEDDMVPR
jgi:hypothetical protein